MKIKGLEPFLFAETKRKDFFRKGKFLMICNKFFTVILVIAAILFSLVTIGLGARCAYLYIAPEEREAAALTDIAAGGRVNLLFLATDESGLLTDTVMLCSLDSERERINILSIPRDTRVRRDGSFYKFNSLYALGEEGKRHEEPIRYVKELTALPIHYYAVLQPDGVRKIVDTLGGVWIDVPQRMYYRDPEQNLTIDLSPGYQLLDGEKAEQFTRFRAGYADADLGRIDAQQMFLSELIRQKAKPRYLGKAAEIFTDLSSYVDTNLKVSDLPLFVKFLTDFGGGEICTYRMPLSEEYVNGISYVICDVGKTRELIWAEFLGLGESTP